MPKKTSAQFSMHLRKIWVENAGNEKSTHCSEDLLFWSNQCLLKLQASWEPLKWDSRHKVKLYCGFEENKILVLFVPCFQTPVSSLTRSAGGTVQVCMFRHSVFYRESSYFKCCTIIVSGTESTMFVVGRGSAIYNVSYVWISHRSQCCCPKHAILYSETKSQWFIL